MNALKRNFRFNLNLFELGYLRGALSKEIMARMEKEAPILWLQIEGNSAKVYAESDGHPDQKQAKKEFDELHEKLHEALLKEIKEK